MTNIQTNIKLSVLIPCYNHDFFIEKAIKSALSQYASFDFEIIIGDDHSSDGSIEIIKKLQAENPKIIRTILNEQNAGVTKLVAKLFSAAKGDYIAILEGDDEWINDQKIEKQVSFLETNPDYEAVFHDAKIVSHFTNKDLENKLIKNQSKINYTLYSEKFNYLSEYNIEDILLQKNIPASSLVLRKRDYNIFFNKYKDINLTIGWFAHLHVIKNGKFKYIKECWSIYNDHKAGVTKKIDYAEFNKTSIFMYKELLKDHFFKNHKKLIRKSIANQYICLYSNPINKYKLFKRFLYGILFVKNSFQS